MSVLHHSKDDSAAASAARESATLVPFHSGRYPHNGRSTLTDGQYIDGGEKDSGRRGERRFLSFLDHSHSLTMTDHCFADHRGGNKFGSHKGFLGCLFFPSLCLQQTRVCQVKSKLDQVGLGCSAVWHLLSISNIERANLS